MIKIKGKVRKFAIIALAAVVMNLNTAPVVAVDTEKGLSTENAAFILPSGRTSPENSGGPDKSGGGGNSFDFKKPLKQADMGNIRDKMTFLRDAIKQCQPSDQENVKPTVTEKFPTNHIRKLVKRALSNQDVKREYNSFIAKLKAGYRPEQIGGVRTVKNLFLLKGSNARILVEVSENKITILGVGYRGNIDDFKQTMNNQYNANIKYS